MRSRGILGSVVGSLCVRTSCARVMRCVMRERVCAGVRMRGCVRVCMRVHMYMTPPPSKNLVGIKKDTPPCFFGYGSFEKFELIER
jgi:hypothetical protein